LFFKEKNLFLTRKIDIKKAKYDVIEIGSHKQADKILETG